MTWRTPKAKHTRGPKPHDPRYSSRRWQQTRLLVLHRDLWRCWAPGCKRRASIADHIEPTWLGMPDALFFSMANLRACCTYHNLVVGRQQAEASAYAVGVVHKKLHSRSPFSNGVRRQDAALLPSISPKERYAPTDAGSVRISQDTGASQPKLAEHAGEPLVPLTGDYSLLMDRRVHRRRAIPA